jgi:hypothetical protein
VRFKPRKEGTSLSVCTVLDLPFSMDLRVTRDILILISYNLRFLVTGRGDPNGGETSRLPMRSLDFSIDLILPAALCP